MESRFAHPYTIDPAFSKKVAYFCMEFGIDQPLKTYAGGLGYLAGSHMRSAYDLHQNMIGIGILWKYGYYDQVRKPDQCMDVLFEEKYYSFLEPTQIRFTIQVTGHDVWVTAYYLPPEIFKTIPLFFLTTDLPENDYLARTISHKLYDANPETKIAAAILLGEGGARLLELLGWEPAIYHLNESHALPLLFYLYAKYKSLDEVRKKVVFTNHTPEESGNMQSDMSLLYKMNFFNSIPLAELNAIVQPCNGLLDHTRTAFRFSGKANAVSALHQKTLEKMWGDQKEYCPLIAITNAQHFGYWHSEDMYQALRKNDDTLLREKKEEAKHLLFEIVADQSGKIFDTKTCTLVFAKRFTGYKRADLLLHNPDRFHELVSNKEKPIQVIWAGKPYPMDYTAIGTFDKIVDVCKKNSNCAILSGYELWLSKILKRGADIWLNVPRITHEASGTSGMAAAMNGSVNVSIPDGWFPEFARDQVNSFVIPPCDASLPDHQQDDTDAEHLYNLLAREVLPLYYDFPDRWLQIIKSAMEDIIPRFDSHRMAREYYEKLYQVQ